MMRPTRRPMRRCRPCRPASPRWLSGTRSPGATLSTLAPTCGRYARRLDYVTEETAFSSFTILVAVKD